MKIKALFTSLFMICALATGQISFGMEEKRIVLPTFEAPQIGTKNFDKSTVTAAIFDPANENKILIILSEECQEYDLESKISSKKELNNNNKDQVTTFIQKNSSRSVSVGPYALAYSDRFASLTTYMLGNTVTISDKETNTPLYTISHKSAIKCVSFNADHTKLITVSYDNNVKISAIKKPIIMTCEETSILCNPDILSRSQTLHSQINFTGSDNSSTIDLVCPLECFNQIVQLMVLTHKNDKSEIESLLNKLNVNSLCTLLEISDYLIIENEKINLTDIIYELIANKYNPKTNQLRVQQLPLLFQNRIAQHRVKNCIRHIDDHVKPLSFSAGGSSSYDRSKVSSRNGKYFAQLHNNHTAQIWNNKTKQITHTFDDPTHKITSIALSPDSNYFATYSQNNTVKIWDLNTGQVKHTFTNQNDRNSWISLLEFSPDEKSLVTGSYDKTVKIWDLNTGQVKHTLIGISCDSRIVSLRFGLDGKSLTIGFGDATAKTWNIDDTAKQKLLNELTIEQADFLTEKVYSMIKQDKIFEIMTDSAEHSIWNTFVPAAQKYLQDHVKIIAALPIQPAQLDHVIATTNNKAPIQENKVPSNTADATGLPKFFSEPFISKKLLWGGVIGAFATTAIASLFCYYQYFKCLPRIF